MVDYGDRMPAPQSRPMVNQLGDLLKRVKTGTRSDVGSQGQPVTPFDPRTPITEIGDAGAARIVYDVRDYGAVGDGVADDTEALQAAINAASARGGGVVYLAAGSYRCASTVQLAVGVSLLGENYLASQIVVDGAHVGLNYSPGGLTELGIVLQGLRVIGTPVGAATATTLVNLQNCRTVVIRNCNIRDCTTHGVALNFCFNIRIESTPIESFGADGIHAVSSNSCVVDNSEFGSNGPTFTNAISLDTCACWTIVNATTEAAGHGANGLKLKDCSQITLIGSFMEGLTGTPIDATAGTVTGFHAFGNNVIAGTSVAWDFSGVHAHQDIVIENNRSQVPNTGTIFAPGAATSFSYRFNNDAPISGALAAIVSGFAVALTDVVLQTGQRQAGTFDVQNGYLVAGLGVVGARRTGWTPATGTAARGTYATFAGQTISNPPTQTQVQNIDNHMVIVSQRLKALIDDLHNNAGHGLIGT